MKKTIKASIYFDTTEGHPDSKGMKNLEYSDAYRIDTDYFMGYDSIDSFIRQDLALVAGGGYDTDNIENVKYNLKEE